MVENVLDWYACVRDDLIKERNTPVAEVTRAATTGDSKVAFANLPPTLCRVPPAAIPAAAAPAAAGMWHIPCPSAELCDSKIIIRLNI